MLANGEVRSIGELALRLGKERGQVGHTLKLAYLSPSLTRAPARRAAIGTHHHARHQR
jgi:hypothetical protein